jgi:hypothetical protein
MDQVRLPRGPQQAVDLDRAAVRCRRPGNHCLAYSHPAGHAGEGDPLPSPSDRGVLIDTHHRSTSNDQHRQKCGGSVWSKPNTGDLVLNSGNTGPGVRRQEAV